MGAAAVPMMVAGGAMKAYGELAESEEKSWAMQQEAVDAERSAVNARLAGKYNAERQQIVADKTIGGAKADIGASGISSDSLSALESLRESHMNAELDRQNIIFGAESRASNYQSKARALRKGAGSVETAGKIGAFASLFTAGAMASNYGD